MQGFLIGSVLINHDSQRAVHEDDIVVVGGKTRRRDSKGAAHGALRRVVTGEGERAAEHVLGLVVHEALVAHGECRQLVAEEHGSVFGGHGQRSLANGELSGLRAFVVALTGHGHGGGAGVHVVAVAHGVVGTFLQHGVAVLHDDGGLLLSAVVDHRCGVDGDVECLRAGGHDAPLGGCRAREVLRGTEGCCSEGIGAHVSGLAGAVVVTGRHLDGAGPYAGNVGRLLFLVVHELCLGQLHRRQRGLADAHLEVLRSHVVVVPVAYHLIVYGILTGVEARGNRQGIVHAVERVAHLAAVSLAAVNQRLVLGGVHQTALGLGSRRRDVGLVDGKGLRRGAGILLAGAHGGDGHRRGIRLSVGGAGVLVVRIAHGVVRALHERHAVEGHHGSGLLGVAVVDEVVDGGNHAALQRLLAHGQRTLREGDVVVA